MSSTKNGLFFIIDETNSHNGITDRLKAAVGLYYIAKCSHADFHFIHRAGFDLRDYLKPNKVPWSAELSDIPELSPETKYIEYLPPFSGIPEIDPDQQYVCRRYIGKNIIEMTDVPDWQRVWRDLFWELFTPDEKVLEALAQAEMPERYVAVNARFINSLGRFEDADYNAPLPEKKQEELIDEVLLKVAEIVEESALPAVISSDSVRFMEEAERRGFQTIDTKGTGHIMNPDVEDLVYLKTFVNFFLLARAEKIYSILNVEGVPENSLYKTQYPRYAAIIGDKPFIRI